MTLRKNFRVKTKDHKKNTTSNMINGNCRINGLLFACKMILGIDNSFF